VRTIISASTWRVASEAAGDRRDEALRQRYVGDIGLEVLSRHETAANAPANIVTSVTSTPLPMCTMSTLTSSCGIGRTETPPPKRLSCAFSDPVVTLAPTWTMSFA